MPVSKDDRRIAFKHENSEPPVSQLSDQLAVPTAQLQFASWSPRSHRLAVNLVLLLSIALSCGHGDVAGQVITERVLLTAPREYQQYLRRATEAITNGEYSDAIQYLDPILSGRSDTTTTPGSLPADDYFLGTSTEGLFRQSLRNEARRLLTTLPEEGRELYELQYGTDAQQLLERAVNERDVFLLSQDFVAVSVDPGRTGRHVAVGSASPGHEQPARGRGLFRSPTFGSSGRRVRPGAVLVIGGRVSQRRPA